MVSAKNQDEELGKLIRQALDGNRTAFGEIYDLYAERVYRFIFYRVNHHETAEDLVAEVFVRVWTKLSGIRGPEAFPGWLFQIARNLVIDHYRTRKPQVDLSELENVLEYEDNFIDKTNLGFEQKEFLKALKKLSQDQQIVIKFKFIDELTNQEIAEILNKSEGAIRVIQHRAITELKKLLNQHDDNG